MVHFFKKFLELGTSSVTPHGEHQAVTLLPTQPFTLRTPLSTIGFTNKWFKPILLLSKVMNKIFTKILVCVLLIKATRKIKRVKQN